MIDPASLDMLPLNDNTPKTLHIDYIPDYDFNPYNLNDEKSYSKFIVDLEREVRSSFEYKNLVKYLKSYCGMNRCAYFENTEINPDSKVTIEIHHHPFTLYDICTIVCTKRMYYGEPMNLEMVSEEVMRLHYEGKVGLIPLSKTPHELYHNGFLPIPLYKVRGNWKAFRNEYWDFFSDEQKDIYDRILQFDSDYNEKQAKKVLEQKNIYIESAISEYQIPDLKPVLGRITDRVQEIKQNHYMLPMASDDAYKEQQLLIQKQYEAEIERKNNMVNPIIEYTDEMYEEWRKLNDCI